MARLDRLAPAKEVAQVGAMIGREFSHRLLAAVLGDAARAARRGAGRAGALRARGAARRAARRGLHLPPRADPRHRVQQHAQGPARAAPRPDRRGDRAGRARHAGVAQPELLAYHCQEGGQADEALRYWRAAGDLAVAALRQPRGRDALPRCAGAAAALERAGAAPGRGGARPADEARHRADADRGLFARRRRWRASRARASWRSQLGQTDDYVVACGGFGGQPVGARALRRGAGAARRSSGPTTWRATAADEPRLSVRSCWAWSSFTSASWTSRTR